MLALSLCTSSHFKYTVPKSTFLGVIFITSLQLVHKLPSSSSYYRQRSLLCHFVSLFLDLFPNQKVDAMCLLARPRSVVLKGAKPQKMFSDEFYIPNQAYSVSRFFLFTPSTLTRNHQLGTTCLLSRG